MRVVWIVGTAKPKRSAVKATRDDDLYLIGFAADNEWEETYIEALEATGKKDEAHFPPRAAAMPLLRPSLVEQLL